MRWLTLFFLGAIALATIGWKGGEERIRPAVMRTTEATLAPDEAIPVVAEAFADTSPNVYRVPRGWSVVSIGEDARLDIEHADGSRATIAVSSTGGRSTVSWHILYGSDSMNCISSAEIQVSDAEASIEGVSYLTGVEADGQRSLHAISAPWPERVGNTLVTELNPATRHGICTR